MSMRENCPAHVVRVRIGCALRCGEAATPKTVSPKAAPAAADYNEVFKGIKFREIGLPRWAGRIDDFAVVESNPDIIYVGTAAGGVFKTINGGTTWSRCSTISRSPRSAMSPSRRPILPSSGSVAARRTSPELFVGQRRLQIDRRGETWKHVGLDASMHIGRIVISPADRIRSTLPREQLVGSVEGARGLQKRRRREDVEQRSLRERGHGR